MTQTRVVEWNQDEIEATYHQAGVKALLVGAQYLLSLAVAQVPLDEATLMNSGVATVDPIRLQAAVSFDTPYAVRQHEDLTFRHPGGRKAKYLEDPMTGNRTQIYALIAATYRRSVS